MTSKNDPRPMAGIHHVTAIAGDPRRNLDLYAGVLGLRLVKKTVNFDDPSTYHLYYGDAEGSPGSIMTFFPWPGARRGRHGVGQTAATAFAVPVDSIGWWRDRLQASGIASDESERFGGPLLTLRDADGLVLELVGSVTGDDPRPPWDRVVPSDHAIRGFDGVTLQEADEEPTAAALEVMGFRRLAEDGRRVRFVTGDGGSGARVDVLVTPDAARGLGGAGTVHHVAFRAVDDADQLAWRSRLARAMLQPTDVKDRNYFHSIYYREPGGVLFELATDPPGFTVDEPLDALGETLRLPPWLEPARARIEAVLPPLGDLPAAPSEAEATGGGT
ncbi:MAG: ring-cleaving dioxygenase [Acidobacteriota bacterium]